MTNATTTTEDKLDQLNYVVPPENQGKALQVAYAVTASLVVCRSTELKNGIIRYAVADLCDMFGEFEPRTRAPNVSLFSWEPAYTYT